MPRRKRNFGWVKWLILLILMILVKNNFDNGINNDNQAVNTEKSDIKKSEEDKTGEKADNNSDDSNEKTEQEEKVPQYDGESPNRSETLTGVISYAGVSGDNLIVRVNIDQYLAGGSCKMNLIKDGATVYNNTVAIESSVSTSTCNGFNVSVSEVGSGNFRIEVTLESDGKYGKIVGEVSI